MRTTPSSTITFATADQATGPGQRTDFIQSSSVLDLLERLAAIATELGAPWFLAFVNLGGGGSGAEYVLELRWGSTDVLQNANGLNAAIILALGAQGAQSAANLANLTAALAAFQGLHAAQVVVFVQSLLTGASQGARITDMLLSGDLTPG